jgi:anti-sigma B factor antagonist
VLAQGIQAFRCDVVPQEDGVIVAPAGEMDMATVGAVEAELRALRIRGFDKIVLDLNGLTFMDSTGLHLAVRWSTAAARDGFDFKLTRGGYMVQRVFALAELDDELPFVER